MRYTKYLFFFISLFLFVTCRPEEIIPKLNVATIPILNATISGQITSRDTKLPLADILIVLKKDTTVIDTIRTPMSGVYQFKILDKDTLRQYKYSIEIPFNGNLIFNESYYTITQDSIQIKDFTACPAGFLFLKFENQSLTDSLYLLHSQMNCVDSEDYKIKISVDKGLGISFLGGIFKGPLRLAKDTITLFKVANNAIFDVKGFKNGKMIINRKDTISIKVGVTTPFTYKY